MRRNGMCENGFDAVGRVKRLGSLTPLDFSPIFLEGLSGKAGQVSGDEPMQSRPENPNELARHWIERLRGTDIAGPQWEEAVEELRKLGFGIVSQLIDAWGDGSMAVRWGTSRALYRMGPRVVGDVIMAVGHKNRWVRDEAVLLLHSVVQKEQWQVVDILSALVKALEDPESRVRERAAKAMSAYRRNAEEAIPVLIRGLKDQDPFVRMWMAMTLGSIEPTAEAAIPALTEALLDDCPYVRDGASNSLDWIQRKLRKRRFE